MKPEHQAQLPGLATAKTSNHEGAPAVQSPATARTKDAGDMKGNDQISLFTKAGRFI